MIEFEPTPGVGFYGLDALADLALLETIEKAPEVLEQNRLELAEAAGETLAD